MKKLLLSALALTLTISMVACGNAEEPSEGTPTEAPVTTEAPAEPAVTEEPAATEAPEVTEAPVEGGEVVDGETTGGEVSGETVGQTLLAEFNAIMAEDASLDAYSIAEKVIAHESIQFMGGAMEVEPGFLSGFDNYEVTGFDKGAMFGPMMGSIAFVGYIFELPADADVDAFMTSLKDNANPRWQICVEAEETTVEANGNKVFFLMSPVKFEQ